MANLQEGSQSLARPMHLIDSFTAIEDIDVVIEPDVSFMASALRQDTIRLSRVFEIFAAGVEPGDVKRGLYKLQK